MFSFITGTSSFRVTFYFRLYSVWIILSIISEYFAFLQKKTELNKWRLEMRINSKSLNEWLAGVSQLIASHSSETAYSRETGNTVNERFKEHESSKLAYLRAAAAKCREFIQRRQFFANIKKFFKITYDGRITGVIISSIWRNYTI